MENDSVSSHASSSDQTDPRLSTDARYLALRALTTQGVAQEAVMQDRSTEHSPSNTANWTYQSLDENSAAMEKFVSAHLVSLQRNRANGTVSRSSIAKFAQSFVSGIGEWMATTNRRRVGAFAFAMMIFAVVVMTWPMTTVVKNVEAEFAKVDLQVESAKLILPWERPPTSLGFSSEDVANEARLSFSKGLLRGRQMLANNKPVELGRVQGLNNYVALGEWNMLLSAACESDQLLGSDFWERQESLARQLAKASFGEDAPIIELHLKKSLRSLQTLQAAPTKRKARELSIELLRFREQFASRTAPIDEVTR